MPEPLFRFVYADTGEPVVAPLDYRLTPEGEVLEERERREAPCDPSWTVWEPTSLVRVEWLLDPTTGKPPRRRGV